MKGILSSSTLLIVVRLDGAQAIELGLANPKVDQLMEG